MPPNVGLRAPGNAWRLDAGTHSRSGAVPVALSPISTDTSKPPALGKALEGPVSFIGRRQARSRRTIRENDGDIWPAWGLPGQRAHVGLSAALLWYAGGQLLDAVGVCAQEMGDPQLALFLGRIMESPEQPLVSQIVHKELLPGEIKPSTEMDIITAGSITES